jgi:hypothetical protein
MTIYSWNTAPDWARFAATDINGNGFWFENLPSKRFYWDISPKKYNGKYLRMNPDPGFTIPIPWDKSLEKRPAPSE